MKKNIWKALIVLIVIFLVGNLAYAYTSQTLMDDSKNIGIIFTIALAAALVVLFNNNGDSNNKNND